MPCASHALRCEEIKWRGGEEKKGGVGKKEEGEEGNSNTS